MSKINTDKTYRLVNHIDAHIFRAYDIRGTVDDALTPDNVYTIGRAIAEAAMQQAVKHVLVGRDGRVSSPNLSEALCRGLLDGGCDVTDLGMVPTPVLYYAASQTEHRSGVMLTGSHNPVNYNGIKLVLNDHVLAEKAIEALYHTIVKSNFSEGRQGRYDQQQFIQRYIDYIVEQHSLARKLKLVIDCGNGVTGIVAPDLFKALGCNVTVLYGDVDGTFPNHHPDPGCSENLTDLIKTVKQQKADIGLAFDGDGDRLGVVTELGEIIWPDRQLMLFAKSLLAKTQHADIVFDVKCSGHLTKVIESAGGCPVMWKTGHALLRRKLKESEALLAGEMSGHIYFNDEQGLGFDDGMYAGVRLLEILANQSNTVSELFASLPSGVATPELSAAIDDDKKFTLISKLQQKAQFSDAELITIDGLRAEFATGWGLVRASNTTPKIVFRFEADDEASLAAIQQRFKEQLLKIEPTLDLPF